MTLDISRYQYDRFKELGVDVLMTRNADLSLDSVQRTDIVKGSNATYCISNHINAASSTSAKGAEGIYSVYSDGKFAQKLIDALRASNRTIRPTATFSKANSSGGDYYYMHRLTGSVSTTIVEYGFCTNAYDASDLKSNWKKYAEAIVKAYCSHIGHAYTEPKEDEPVQEMSDVFTDVPKGHYSEASLHKAKAKGVLKGYPDGSLGFGEAITPERLAVMLDRLGLLD
jgi:N-acetylmuramoyl-L-alanine amidase